MESHALALVHDNNAKQQQHHPRNPSGNIGGAAGGANPRMPDNNMVPTAAQIRRAFPVISIATISSGFEKGDFLVREEKGQRVYFDFFEEAFNYIAYKGYIRMRGEDEQEWMDTMNHVHAGVKGGMKYNTGKLLLVLYKPLVVTEEGDYP